MLRLSLSQLLIKTGVDFPAPVCFLFFAGSGGCLTGLGFGGIFADFLQNATLAYRPLRLANLPAEMHQPVAEIAAFFRWDDGFQLLFHHRRIGGVGEAQPPADADAVGVGDDGGQMEHVP